LLSTRAGLPEVEAISGGFNWFMLIDGQVFEYVLVNPTHSILRDFPHMHFPDAK